MNKKERDAEDEKLWASWMSNAQNGDMANYSRLLEQLGSAIEQYIRFRFGDIDALEDCVQECLIAIHEARHTYESHRLFRPWMFTIVRHKAIDTLRKRQTWLKMKEKLSTSIESITDSEHLQKKIDGVRILDRLSHDHREVVVLAKYGGYSTAEAAQWLGISESATKVRLHRAMHTIMQSLEQEDLLT